MSDLERDKVTSHWQKMSPRARDGLAGRFNQVIETNSRRIYPRPDMKGVSSSALGFYVINNPDFFGPELNIIEFRLGRFASGLSINTIALGQVEDLDSYAEDPVIGPNKVLRHALEYRELAKGHETKGYFKLAGTDHQKKDYHLVTAKDLEGVAIFTRTVQCLRHPGDITEALSQSLDYLDQQG